MGEQRNFLWLNGIFDEVTVGSFTSISPASNFWQRGFVEALQSRGCRVDLVGHAIERVWPFGRLFVHGKQTRFYPGLTGTAIGYVNTPIVRGKVQYIQYLRAVKRLLAGRVVKPDYVITFSCIDRSSDKSPPNEVAKYVRDRYNVPWICIVADGAAPVGADGYVYLTWSSYQSFSMPGSAIHIDGGVPALISDSDLLNVPDVLRDEKILMYMGALTQHGGSTQLARAFHSLRDDNIRLWICGRGENAELARLAEIDKRISVFGFVSEFELNGLARRATAFANPRPGSFAPNKFNYPSKLLHYLAYGKPVISTITDGISPDYECVLIPISDETEASLATAISDVLNMKEMDYHAMGVRIADFVATHTWKHQVDRFSSWLDSLVLS